MSRSAAGALSALLGALLGVGLLVVLEQPRDGSEAIAPLAAAATAAPSSAPAPSGGPTAAPVATPARVVIPSIDVDADLVAVGLNPDRSMEVPDFGEAGWYEPGPRPGEVGPAVITAHVDSVDGPDVFHRLTDLAVGDQITVERADGTSAVFVMRRAEQQLKEELPVERIWAETDEPVLRLITCGGEFDEARRSYRSNVIVYARTAGA
ncbi:MAG TPA: class F sortase [Euzebyales bacterium]